MPNAVKEKKKTLSPEELNKSLEKSLLKVQGLLRKGKWEKEPGTAATWEIREGKGRAAGSKDAEDDSKIESEYDDDEEENKLLDMEETEEEGDFSEEPWGSPADDEIGDTEHQKTKEQAPFNRKAKISSKSLANKFSLQQLQKAIKIKMKKAEKEDDDDDDDDDEDEREERFGKEKKGEKKMHKSIDSQEAEVAMDAEPFLRRMDQKIKKLEKAIKYQHKLLKAEAEVSLTNMRLSKAIAKQPVPIGSALRKSGAGKLHRETYDPDAILQKSFKLMQEGRINSVDGIKVEEWVNGVRPELPEHLKALFEQSA